MTLQHPDEDTREALPSHAARPWIPAADSFAAQPEILRALPVRLAGALAGAPGKPRRALLVGMGASHAAAATAVTRLRAVGVDASRHLPDELAGMTDADLVIATSQSGRSSEVVEICRDIDAGRILAVTNYDPSPLGDLAGAALGLGNHSDSSVSFLSYTSTLVAFGMLADHWHGTLDVARWDAIIASALASAENARGALSGAADLLAARSSVDVVAPAPIASAAEEAALMFREGPLVPATAMETRLYLHGPMDIAGSVAHVIIGGEREALLVRQLRERTDALVFLGTDSSPAPEAAVTARIDVAHDDTVGQAVAATIMTQFLALEIAERRGIDIDAPVFTRLDTKTGSAAR